MASTARDIVRRIENLEGAHAAWRPKSWTDPAEIDAELAKHGCLRIEVAPGTFIELTEVEAHL